MLMFTAISKNAKRLLKVAATAIFFVCSFNLYRANVVTITSNIPETIAAGATVPVTVTINKGNVEGFGRYTNTLPKGFSATSSDPNFSFTDNTVTILWVKLPKTSTFTVTYNIIAPEKSKNSFTFTAKFGYVQDNEKHFAELTPKTVRISNDATELQIAQVENTTTNQNLNSNDITCYRTVGIYNNEATVSVRIDQSNSKSMCKIEEMLPEGFYFEPIDNAGSTVSNVQNIVRYMWTEAPADKEFSVIYKVKAQKGYDINDLIINGAFSVFENSATKSFMILDNNSSIDESTGRFAETYNESKPIQAEKVAAGKYTSSTVLKDIESHKYNCQQADFFANTDIVNTIYATNQPKVKEVVAEVANDDFSIDDIPAVEKTDVVEQPTSKDVEKFQNDINIPAPTATKVEKEREYEITQTTEKTTKSEVVTSDNTPELISNIMTPKTVKPTMTTIADEQEQEITQTKTEKVTTVTTTTTTIKPWIQKSENEATTVASTKPAKTVSQPTSTAKSKPTNTLSNKNNRTQEQTKVAKASNSKNNKVTYRVQVAACHTPLKNQQAFFTKRNINEKITMEKIDSWYKYTINSFDTYSKARNHRNSVWEQTPIKGAFVVAYNGKQRITVQEALMLTNQKWVK